MKAERWRRVDEVFEAALEREGAERADFLERACAGDKELRAEVERLLRFDERFGDLLEKPAFDIAAQLLTGETAALPSWKRAGARSRRSGSGPSGLTSESIEDARFVPGDVLAGRYRVVGLLGRGGMGEVYRADDLKLKQPVALKFLPERFADDSAAQSRFYQEVSVARQVSHRHVCRVYDIGEHEGSHFISMEYVRGEELSSLLKRIGRLPSDKALEVARQLCAGLAAVHERGVLHRDLKPSNVMLDERGDVRITDFGIAALADDARGRAASVGTPAYMSPEQLKGGELTSRSDIYSLGLVLYELFTGKRAFDAPSLPELLRLRETASTPTTPSSHVKDLDPLVERVILRCTERDPEDRPASAIQVAASLPGGDPLAAALALGETPSPEMVAAAPKRGSLKPTVALALLASVVAGLVVLTLLSDRVSLHRLVPLKKSSEALKERAAEMARSFGYADAPADTAHGFSADVEHILHIRDGDKSPDRWERLKEGGPPVINFWYRQSPRYLVAYDNWAIGERDPPQNVSGMVLVILDTLGRLSHFEAVPEQQPGEAQGAGAQADWAALFREAGLDINKFSPTQPRWTPPQYADSLAAWEGEYPSRPGETLRVEAASFRGRPVYFKTVSAWVKPSRQVASQNSLDDVLILTILLTFYFGALVLGALLAWRNLRAGRGDRKGAFRLALFVFFVRVAHWAFSAHHVPTEQEVLGLLLVGLQSALYAGCVLGLMYLALEPFLRRRRAEWLISWSRLLAGDFRDPLVGRDLLVGAALGVGMMLGFYLDNIAPAWFGAEGVMPNLGSGLIYTTGIEGLSGFTPLLTNAVMASVMQTFIVTFLVFLSAAVLRRDWAGIAMSWALVGLLGVLVAEGAGHPAGLVAGLVAPTLIIVAVVRFGLLTLMSALFFTHTVVFFPMTTELSAWYAGGFVLFALLLVGLAVYGFYTSLAGQTPFRADFLDD